MNIKSFLSVAKTLPPDIAILMRGATGIGKSHIARQISEYHNIPLVDVRGSTMSEGDVGGYPDIDAMKESGIMTFCMPSWFVRACREPVVLLLDELNRSLPGVQQSFFQLVLDRELGNDKNGMPYKLNPETRVIAAVNHGSEYDVNDMDPALLRRFWVVDLDCKSEEWIDWGRKNDIDELIIEFISTHNEHLRVDPTSVEPGVVIPSPASWARFDHCLKYAKIDLVDKAGTKGRSSKIYNMATGLLGQEASIAFTEFLQKYKVMITPEDILDDWLNIKEKVDKLTSDKINGLISKLANHFELNAWTIAQAENASLFAKTISHEMLVHMWSELTKTRKIENIQKFHKFVGEYLVEVVNNSKSNLLS